MIPGDVIHNAVFTSFRTLRNYIRFGKVWWWYYNAVGQSLNIWNMEMSTGSPSSGLMRPNMGAAFEGRARPSTPKKYNSYGVAWWRECDVVGSFCCFRCMRSLKRENCVFMYYGKKSAASLVLGQSDSEQTFQLI